MNGNADELPVAPLDAGDLDTVTLQERILKSRQVGLVRQGGNAHLMIETGIVGVHGRQAGEGVDAVERLAHEGVAHLPHGGPVMFRLEVDGRGHAQVGGNVVRAQPLQIIEKVGAEGEGFGRSPPPTNDQRLQQVLHLGVGVEESGAFGATEPLVPIAGVEVRAEGGHVQGNLAQGVRAIHDGEDVGGAGTSANFGDGEAEGGGGGDVAEEDDFGAGGDALP